MVNSAVKCTVSTVTTLRAGRPGARILTGAKDFSLLRKRPDQVLGPKGSMPGIKQPGSNVDHSPLSGTKDKNEWRYPSTPPHTLSWYTQRQLRSFHTIKNDYKTTPKCFAVNSNINTKLNGPLPYHSYTNIPNTRSHTNVSACASLSLHRVFICLTTVSLRWVIQNNLDEKPIFKINLLPNLVTMPSRHAVAQFVQALCYKPEGRVFDSQWCNWNFSLT